MRNLFLATHGIGRDDTALEVQKLEEFGSSGDLIGLVFGFHLAQSDSVCRRPGTDHVNGCFIGRTIIGTSQRLAINGHGLRIGELKDGMNPTGKALLELLRAQQGKHPAESIMRWYAMGQCQELLEPIFLGLGIVDDFSPVVRTTNHSANGNDNDVNELVACFQLNPGVLQCCKIFGDRSCDRLLDTASSSWVKFTKVACHTLNPMSSAITCDCPD